MNLAALIEEIRGAHSYATEDDIRKAFGDYHNLLRWLAAFLTAGEKLTDACVVDACTIAQRQTPVFHEWLVHWAARATVGSALQEQHTVIAELAPKYENSEPVHPQHPPLSTEYLLLLIKKSEGIRARLDALCRFVLVLRGIAKDSSDQVAAQLGISRSAVERAYCVAFDTLEGAADSLPGRADVPASHIDNKLRSPERLRRGDA